MSKCDADDDWSIEETIMLLNIVKQRNLQVMSEISELDWRQVSDEIAGKGYTRTTFELRQRYSRLKDDFFKARMNGASCSFYNNLKDMLSDQSSPTKKEMCEDLASPSNGEDNPFYGNCDTAKANISPHASDAKLHSKWMTDEVENFLSIINKIGLRDQSLCKKNDNLYNLLAAEMANRCFEKTPQQLRSKYLMLRTKYFRYEKYGNNFEHLKAMTKIINPEKASASSISEVESNESELYDDDADATLATDNEGDVNWTRCKWAEGEVAAFLNIINSSGLQKKLLRARNEKVFKMLSQEMAKISFSKTPEKLRIKYHQLRRQYIKAKNCGTNFEHFEAMDKLANAITSDSNLVSGADSNDTNDEDEDTQRRTSENAINHHYWSDEEVDTFLSLIKQSNLLRALDGSKKRNFKTLNHLSKLLAQRSYNRTPFQLRNKLRLLITRYKQAKKDGVDNVRLLPRHFKMLDDLLDNKKTQMDKMSNADAEEDADEVNQPTKMPSALNRSDSDKSNSSCDLLREVAQIEGFENEFEMPVDPTPAEVLIAINDRQKDLLSFLKTSNENFLKQQREMQNQFLQEMSTQLHREREETFKLFKEMLQSTYNYEKTKDTTK